MHNPIPCIDLNQQLESLKPKILEAFERVFDSRVFVLGPEVDAFEQAFAEFAEAPFAVACSSGTSALHLATHLLDLGPGDEVITTPYTFAATLWAISYQGATPVLVDIERETFNIDVEQIEQAITPKTRAIIAVHLYGQPCAMDALQTLCDKHGIALIEDCAQAHGARFGGKAVGNFGRVGTFSFYPTKNMPACGEGGCVLAQTEEDAARLRALRNHGSVQRYHHSEVGYNYRMDALQGAALRVQLEQLPEWNQQRRALAHRYHDLLKETPLALPREAENCESVYHLYTVIAEGRDALCSSLKEAGIGYSMHYPKPMHLQECYQPLGYKRGDFPVAEAACEQCINLPLFPGMTEEQQTRVAEVIKAFYGVTA